MDAREEKKMMKQIKLKVFNSVDEKKEEIELKKFINLLNEISEKKEIYLELTFGIGDDLGNERLKKDGQYIYFMESATEKVGPYYTDSIEEIKLHFLLELIYKHPEFEGKLQYSKIGWGILDGREVVNLSKLPIYYNNQKLIFYKKEKERLGKELEHLRTTYLDNKSKAIDWKEIFEATRLYMEADIMQELDYKIWNLYITLTDFLYYTNRNVTWRERNAAESLRLGDFEKAVHILDDEKRREELQQKEKDNETDIKYISSYISENKLLIESLMAMGVKQSLQKIKNIFDENIRLVKTYHMAYEEIYEYITFLCQYSKTDMEKACCMGEQLEVYYAQEDYEVEEGVIAELEATMGYIYYELKKFAKAETSYRKAIKIYEEIAKTMEMTYVEKLALQYNNLANILQNQGNYEEAKYLLLKALEKYQQLVQKAPHNVELKEHVAITMSNLACLISDAQKYEDAKDYFEQAIAIADELASDWPNVFEETANRIKVNKMIEGLEKPKN